MSGKKKLMLVEFFANSFTASGEAGVARGWGAGMAESGWGVGWKRDRELFCELVAIHFYVNI